MLSMKNENQNLILLMKINPLPKTNVKLRMIWRSFILTSRIRISVINFFSLLKVDVTTVQPISAYYSSDEEKDDEDILLYLPIAPEVEDPEDGWNPSAELEDGASAGTKRSSHQDQKENSSPKKKRTKSYEISLANAPTDGTLEWKPTRLFYYLSGLCILIVPQKSILL